MSLAAIIENYKTVREELSSAVRAQLEVEFKKLFDKYPEIESFGWVQYAPYFNDGDPCEFSVYDLCYYAGTPTDLDEDYREEYEDSWYREGYISRSEPRADLVAFSEQFSSIPADFMRDFFGNDAKVIVTRDGINVDEYQHD